MVKVKSSRGGLVQVDIKGIAAVMKNLRRVDSGLVNTIDIGIVQVGNFVQQEVQESIVGKRSEHKSVDTGLLANSIEVSFPDKNIAVIAPDKEKYPGGQNTQDVAAFMEFGTSRGLAPRKHFGNTKARVEPKVVNVFRKGVGKVLRLVK